MTHPRRSTLIVIGAAACLLVLSITLDRLISANQPALGEPRVAAAFNRRLATIPPEDRAWPIYVEAARLIRPLPRELDGSLIEPAPEPDDPTWPVIADYLRTHAPGLAKLRQAAAKPHVGCVLSVEGDPDYTAVLYESDGRQPPAPDADRASGDAWPMDFLLPQLGEFRIAVRILRADAALAAHESDSERFTADCEAIFAIGRHAGETPFLTSRLTFFYITGVAVELVTTQLARDPDFFDIEQLARLRRSIEGMPTGLWDFDLDSERATLDDVHDRIFAGGNRPTRAGVAEFERHLNQTGSTGSSGTIVANRVSLRRSRMAGRAETDGRLDEWLTAARADAAKHLWQRESTACDQLLLGTFVSARGRYPTFDLLSPLTTALNTRDQSRMQRVAFITAIALEQHRRLHNRYPATLADLDPSLSPPPTLDEFSGQQLLYKLSASGPCLYSVGPDRDDDGGRPAAPPIRPVGGWTKPPPDGDLIFLAQPEQAE